MSEKQQQPVASPGMVVSPGGARNRLNKPYNNKGKRGWSHGLLDCLAAMPTCCVAYFCAPCIYNKNRTRLSALKDGHVHPNGGDACGGPGCGFCMLNYCFGLGCILEMTNRGEIRSRYAIDGTGCNDCCTVCCCLACAMTQEARELEEEERALSGR